MSEAGELGSKQALKGGTPADEDPANFKVKAGAGGTIMVVVAIVAVVAIIGGGVWFCGFREDPTEVHRVFQTTLLLPAQHQYYDGFWDCALDDGDQATKGAPFASIKKNTEVISRIREASGDAAGHAKRLREDAKCLPNLEAGIAMFQKLKTNPATPPEYSKLLDDVVEQMKGVQKAWTAFADYQSTADDRMATNQEIVKTGQAWVAYQEYVIANTPEKATELAGDSSRYVGFLSCLLDKTAYTSFVGEEGGLASDKIASALDLQCDTDRATYLDRIASCGASKLKGSGQPGPEFTAAAEHWTKAQGDYTSLETLAGCIDRISRDRVAKLTEDISTAWAAYDSSYQKLLSYSYSKSGGYIGASR